MDKRLELTMLADFYAPLLTEHRREILRLRLEEDLTFQEIADQLGISRQGVHDAVRTASQQLARYEETLGLAGRYRRLEQAMTECRAHLERVSPTPGSEEELKAALASLQQIEKIER